MNKNITLEFVPKTSAGKLSKKYVRETEAMIGLNFEYTFLKFLEKNNGGVPKKRYFKLGNNTKVVDCFLCLIEDYQEHPKGDTDIGVVWSQIEDRLNDYLVPFAALFAGDFLCFDYKKEGAPKIVMWDHEKSEEDTPKTYLVAKNFNEFLDMLFDDEEQKTVAPVKKALPKKAPIKKKK